MQTNAPGATLVDLTGTAKLPSGGERCGYSPRPVDAQTARPARKQGAGAFAMVKRNSEGIPVAKAILEMGHGRCLGPDRN